MITQRNFGQSGKAFTDGDADYNGTVDFNDFSILQSNFGVSIPSLPNQPGGVVVGASVVGSFDVGWTANTDTRDGFKVYRSDDDGLTYTLVHTDPDPDPDARAWTDNGPFDYGKRYWYRVRAYTNAAGASASVTRAWGMLAHADPVAFATPRACYALLMIRSSCPSIRAAKAA